MEKGKQGLRKVVSNLALEQAEKSAKIHSSRYCRWWIGVEKVPTALLEKECQQATLQKGDTHI